MVKVTKKIEGVPFQFSSENKKDIDLFYAILSDDYDSIKKCVEAGANVNLIISSFNDTALTKYADRSKRIYKRYCTRDRKKDLDIVDFLCKHGANLEHAHMQAEDYRFSDVRDLEGTSLKRAIHFNDMEMVQLLLSHGAKISYKERAAAEEETRHKALWREAFTNYIHYSYKTKGVEVEIKKLIDDTYKRRERDKRIKQQSSRRKEQRQELAQMPKGKRKKSTLMKTLQEGSYERNEKANELKQARQERDFKAKEEIRLQKEKAFKAHVGRLKQKKNADKKRTGVVTALDRLNTLPADDIRKKLKKMVVDDYHNPQPQKDITDTPPKVEQEKPVMDTPPKAKTEKPQTNKKTQQKEIISRLFGGGRK